MNASPPGRRPQTVAAPATRRPRLHALETARMLHALEDPPRRTQADIARETGRSPAYVSILCRVGEAIRTLSADDQARLCQPHVTYSALAALVPRHKQPDALRAALQALAARRPRSRAALRGASLWGPGGGPSPNDDPLDPIPAPGPAVRGAAPAPGARGTRAYTYAFDPAAWRQDAEAALAAFEAHVQTLCEGVMRDAIRAVGADAGALGTVTVPPHAPAALGAAEVARLSTQERALRFAGLERSLQQLEAGALATLRGHRARLAAFEAERALVRDTRAGAPRRVAAAPARRETPSLAGREDEALGCRHDDPLADTVTADDIDADLQ